MGGAWQNLPASESVAARKAKARNIVAYLSYALAEVRALSPTAAYLLEMSINAIGEDAPTDSQTRQAHS
ncbi:MAG: hypothetical protein ABUL53_05690 [Bradyrhizobium guangdongense]